MGIVPLYKLNLGAWAGEEDFAVSSLEPWVPLGQTGTIEKKRRDTFKIILQEVRVLSTYFAGWPGVPGVADALCAVDAAAVAVAHLLALRADVHIVNGPSHWLGSGRVKPLVPPEPCQPEKGIKCAYFTLNNSYVFFAFHIYHSMHIYSIPSVGTGLINSLILETDCYI